MARTTAELLEQIRRLAPAYYETGEALLAGFAAAIARAEVAQDVLRDLATFEGAYGTWLTLHARGYGIRRAPGEDDSTLRIRLRSVEDQVTKPAVKAAVDRIIAPLECQIQEWFDGPYLDDNCWLDCPGTYLSGGPRTFLVVIPALATSLQYGAYLDTDLWLDVDPSYLGSAGEDPVYEAIVNEVERLRPAGTGWRLVLES